MAYTNIRQFAMIIGRVKSLKAALIKVWYDLRKII